MKRTRRSAAAAVLAAVAACASLAPPRAPVVSRVGEVLEQRGLGPDALRVMDNLVRHGPPPPPARAKLALELLAQPLNALDGYAMFHAVVPAMLASMERNQASFGKFEDLLSLYLAELAHAQRVLRSALRAFDDEPLLRRLETGLPSPVELLALADSTDLAEVQRANAFFIDATVRLASRLRDAPLEPGSFESPIGTVVVGTRGDDRHGPHAALIIDPGGNDVYERAPARNGAVSVIIDLGGNDHYHGSDVAVRALSAIVDLAGDDRYLMDGSGIGAALAGTSLVLDFAGNDRYEAKFFAQGAAAFGFGALVDVGGQDSYRVEAWGQGFGIGGGTGVLWDRDGDDRYVASGVPDPFGRGAGLSGAQGAGFGLRPRLGGGTGILRVPGADVCAGQRLLLRGRIAVGPARQRHL